MDREGTEKKICDLPLTSGTFTLSAYYQHAENSDRSFGAMLVLKSKDGSVVRQKSVSYGLNGRVSLTFTLDEFDYTQGIDLYAATNLSVVSKNTNCLVSNIQLEVGSNMTEFELYSTNTEDFIGFWGNSPTEINVIYPTTSLYINNKQAVMYATYYADTKKYIDNNYTKLSTSQVGYIDAGTISDYI